jgi:hypothetical protein
LDELAVGRLEEKSELIYGSLEAKTDQNWKNRKAIF